MKRGINISDEFNAAVEEYQKARKLRSWNAALIELAAIGIDKTFGIIVRPSGTWGGDHRSEHFRQQETSIVEHLEVELLVLPPLADDDAPAE
jgi:hypothetical protein